MGDLRFDITSQFHYAFWCGDLNYRIDQVREEIDEKRRGEERKK